MSAPAITGIPKTPRAISGIMCCPVCHHEFCGGFVLVEWEDHLPSLCPDCGQPLLWTTLVEEQRARFIKNGIPCVKKKFIV